jgi:hypothetical protein
MGCGDFTLFGEDETNQSPTADASDDNDTPLACEKDTVNLDGTGSSDPDGDALTYQWEITASPAGSEATLSSTTSAQPSFQPDEPGSYEIELTVEDGRGGSDTDSVTVTAQSDPVADAGADQQVSLDDMVTLDGADSVNPDQDCSTEGLTFSWTLIDPDDIESDLGTDVQASFTASKEGTYTATLEVTRDSDTDSDEVGIEVEGTESALEALQGGPYEFTVEEVVDGIFAFQALEILLPPETVLDETVDIPALEDLDEGGEMQTVSLNLGEGATVDLEINMDQEDPADDFYTVSGTASGGITVTVPIIGQVSCELIRADCDGQITPVTETTVTGSLTISNPQVDSGCQDYTNPLGTVGLTLSGELQE